MEKSQWFVHSSIVSGCHERQDCTLLLGVGLDVHCDCVREGTIKAFCQYDGLWMATRTCFVNGVEGTQNLGDNRREKDFESVELHGVKVCCTERNRRVQWQSQIVERLSPCRE